MRGIAAEILHQRGMVLHQRQEMGNDLASTMSTWIVDLGLTWMRAGGASVATCPPSEEVRPSRIKDRDQGSEIRIQNQGSEIRINPQHRGGARGQDASLDKVLEAENVSRDFPFHVAIKVTIIKHDNIFFHIKFNIAIF